MSTHHSEAKDQGQRSIEPMLWVVVGLPVACLIAIAATLYVLGGAGSLDSSSEPVRRVAQVQTINSYADEQAARMGLAAGLRPTETGFRIDLTDPSSSVHSQDLELHWRHPVEARADFDLILIPDGDDSWVTRDMSPDLRERIAAATSWTIALGPSDDAWQLFGVWESGTSEARLVPKTMANSP